MVKLIIGAPGAGKSTVCKHLPDESTQHISTGDIFRNEIKKGTEIGNLAASLINDGNFVPDDVTNDVIKNFFITCEYNEEKVILDGYPRNIYQVDYIENNLKEIGVSVSNVIHLIVDKDTLIKRLTSRGRDDDDIETVKKRLETYEKVTEPVVEYYRNKQMVNDVNGNDEPFVVANNVYKLIK